MPWTASVVTLFPEMFPGPLACSLAGKGLQKGIWELTTIQIRDFATDKHRTVDDTSYGPNAGMILKPDIVHCALSSAVERFAGTPQILFMTPRGATLTQPMVRDLASSDGVIILCGHYEGIDERVVEHWKTHNNLKEVSVGDYILSGGEIAALTVLDACIRMLPNIMHNNASIAQESFDLDLLEFPQYTKPYRWQEKVVPEILLSGDHKRIAEWQKEQAENVTRVRRPDLWQLYLERKRNGTQGG
ncbi:MAG: tRNA (guanosine(37)-N1)-methyltransferase TrmD [Holosporales bacterium]|jgi:tRNA (guanine37-N1)-methyltransferase|nr:tRNA (guanosine(37)-N1)-methyltransferase TrmD [Holosporales bacterium]